jgi:hypothetical protein
MSTKAVKKITIKDIDTLYNTCRDKMTHDEDMINTLNDKLKKALARITKLERENSKLRGVIKVVQSMTKNSIDESEAEMKAEEEEDDEEDDVEDDVEEEDMMKEDSDDDEVIKPKKLKQREPEPEEPKKVIKAVYKPKILTDFDNHF